MISSPSFLQGPAAPPSTPPSAPPSAAQKAVRDAAAALQAAAQAAEQRVPGGTGLDAVRPDSVVPSIDSSPGAWGGTRAASAGALDLTA